MKITFRKSTFRAIAALAFAAILATPAAGAPSRCFTVTYGPEKNPHVTGKITKRTWTTDRGKMEVRAGYWKGDRVGWARVTGGNPANAIVMKVDLNGDRKPDESCGPDGGFDGTSLMYKALPSRKRAFKACVKLGSDHIGPCHPKHQTGWW